MKNLYTILFWSLFCLATGLYAQPAEPVFSARFKFTGAQALNKEQIKKSLLEQISSLYTPQNEAMADIQKAKKFNKELDQQDDGINETIKTLQENAGILAGLAGLAELRQTISARQKSRDKYQQDFEKQLLENTKTRGLYLVVLPYGTSQGTWAPEDYKAPAQEAMKSRAVKELNQVFITSIRQVVNRKEVEVNVENKVAGTMEVEENLIEDGRRALKQDCILLLYVAVSPLPPGSVSATGTGSANTPPLYLVNCQNQDEVDDVIGKLELDDSWENEIRSKVIEYTDKARNANIIAKGNIQNLWTGLNIELEKLNNAIETAKRNEQEKNAQLLKLTALLFPEGLSSGTLNDTLQHLQKKLDAQRTKILEQKRDYEGRKYFLKDGVEVTLNHGAPVEVFSEAILKSAADLNTSFGNKAVYSEALMIKNLIVERADIKGGIIKRGNLKELWVHVCIVSDKEYKLALIGRFDVSRETGEPQSPTQPEIKEPAPVQILPAPIQKLINDMVYVEGGTFTMGCTAEQGSDCESDERPAHSVTVKNFSIGKYEVTQAQWTAVMGSNPSHFKGCDNCPVENVSWNDTQGFIKKLNVLTGKNFRLPSEAEWEFAARGGTKTQGYKFAGGNEVKDVAWRGGKTQIVGRKIPNELGLYDMSGNVLEWCSGVFYNYPDFKDDILNEQRKVLRGGGYDDIEKNCRITFRDFSKPNNKGSDSGLRLAL